MPRFLNRLKKEKAQAAKSEERQEPGFEQVRFCEAAHETKHHNHGNKTVALTRLATLAMERLARTKNHDEYADDCAYETEIEQQVDVG